MNELQCVNFALFGSLKYDADTSEDLSSWVGETKTGSGALQLAACSLKAFAYAEQTKKNAQISDLN